MQVDYGYSAAVKGTVKGMWKGLFISCWLVFFGCQANAQTTQHARLMEQLGHAAAVEAASFTPNAEFIMTAAKDHTIRWWDVNSGREVRRIAINSGDTNDYFFSLDGKYLLTGEQENRAHLWDVSTGAEIQTFSAIDSAVELVTLSPNGRIAVGATRDEVKFWDVPSGKEVGHISSDALSMAFSPNGQFFLFATKEEASILDLSTRTITKHLVGSSRPKTIFNFETQKSSVEEVPQGAAIDQVQFSNDGKYVLTASRLNGVLLWDLLTGVVVREYMGAANIQSAILSPEGHSVLIACGQCKDGGGIFDSATGKQLTRSYRRNAFSFSPDGQQYLAGAEEEEAVFGKEQTVSLLNAKTGLEVKLFKGFTSSVQDATVSADGMSVLSMNDKGETTLWNVNGVKSWSLPPNSQEVYRGVRYVAGRPVFATQNRNSALFTLWDVTTQEKLFSLSGSKTATATLSFSENGKFAISDSFSDGAEIWDLVSGREVRHLTLKDTPEGSKIGDRQNVALSSDGQLAATATSTLKTSQIKVWAVATGKLLLEKQVPNVWSLCFSHDSARLAYGSFEGTVGIWNLAENREQNHIKVSSEAINALAFGPGDQNLAVATDDGTISLLDVGGGQRIKDFKGHAGWANSVSFFANGTRLLSTGDDGTIRVWNLSTGKELALLLRSSKNGWAVTDPSGHYDANDAANSEALYWVTDNLRTIDLGQLKNEYYTPSLLQRVLHNERLPEVSGMDKVHLPPVLHLAQQYSPESKRILLDVKNDGGGLGKLLVKVNGRLLQTIGNLEQSSEGKSSLLPVDLNEAPFVEGENTISITAYDATNQIESQAVSVRYTSGGAATRGLRNSRVESSMATGTFYAIILGTSIFADPKLNLTFPAKDANTIANGLRFGAERLYGKDHVWIRVLTTDATSEGALPTKRNIRTAFEEVRKSARPEDTLVLYLSGHGVMSGSVRDQYYYLTTDARTLDVDRDPALKDASTISSSELYEWLREPVKTMPLKQVVILDTCAAGGAGDALSGLAARRDIPPDQRRAIELLKDATGTYILMGSAADAASYEASKFGEGLLTYALLEGMRGTALDDGSRLSVNRWFEQASVRVPELAESVGGIQKPVIAAPRGVGFPVALLTSEDRAKIPLATPKPQLLRVVCADGNQDDPLRLRDALREQLRAISDVRARGQSDAPVIYIDASDDEMPGALAPRLLYSVKGHDVSVRIRLVRDRKTVAEESVTASIDDSTFAASLARKIVAMVLTLR